ncbi:MAG: RagB/SusD family nutrient uptake outer membrane protein [Saprospiraceae bacterium]|nr:RagB/SusD family nutrient uptake outer membrane protein [Saprospiraceae bacterium]
MKKIKYFVLPLLMIVFSITSCSDEFLDVPPTGSLSSAELSSKAGLEGALIASYSMLLGRSGFYSDSSNWFWGSVRGGEANKGTNAGDQSQVNEIQAYAAQTNNASVFEKYRTCYEGVARANAVLKLVAVAQEGVSEEDKTRISAEARFLRAHYYFELKKNFNNTPYVDENWDEVTPVGNTADLWTFIEADLKFAFDNLPETMADAGRANKWAAGAYYGKALLYQGKYGEAKTVLNNVVDNGTTANGTPYGLNNSYAMAFRSTNDNSMESVFAAQAAAGTGDINNANAGLVLNFPNGPGAPGGCCGFFQPSFELANSFRTDANGLPLLDGSYNDDANKLKTDMGVEAADPFTVDEGPVDTRLDHSIGRRGIPYLDWGPHPGKLWIRDQPYAGPYAPKKFIYYQAGIGTENDGSSWTPGYTAVNYNIIRFSDVMLMAAEAEIESNGDLGRANDLINDIRQRAANSLIEDSPASYNVGLYGAFSGQADARAALRMERKLELSGEGHRMYDLVRWGEAATALNLYLSIDGPQLNAPFAGASFDAGTDEYLPIPQDEIDLLGSDVLIQNPGY